MGIFSTTYDVDNIGISFSLGLGNYTIGGGYSVMKGDNFSTGYSKDGYSLTQTLHFKENPRIRLTIIGGAILLIQPQFSPILIPILK